MNVIFGGAYQGKLDYAKENFDVKGIFTCQADLAELDLTKDAVDRLEEFVYACVKQGKEAKEYLQEHRSELEDKVIICTDLSQGIVPMDPELRALREMTGRALIYLTKEARTVTRVFCGLGQKIK